MRRVGSIIAVALVLLVGSIYFAPRITLHFAKARAQKELIPAEATAEELAFASAEIDSVPQSSPEKIAFANDYTNTIWLNVASHDLGFPGDRFMRDSDPKRQNVELHGIQYRILVFQGSDLEEWASIMEFVNETNFYNFSRRAFNTTRSDIDRQPDRSALERCMLLLKAKRMLAAVGYTDSCIEFDRGDLKGFIIGDPTRRRNVYIRIYVDGGQRFIDLGIIQDKRTQMSELEELISVLKLQSKS
jgi:hypothetical protein